MILLLKMNLSSKIYPITHHFSTTLPFCNFFLKGHKHAGSITVNYLQKTLT
jgi:hypothetical protein